MSDLTQERLRALLTYDPETGLFHWNSRPSLGRMNADGAAGCFDNNRYRIITISRRPYKAHRLAWLYMTGEWPDGEIDHTNLDPSDNRWANLRVADRSQNNANRRTSSLSKLGIKGVGVCRKTGRFVAAMQHRGQAHYLGTYGSIAEAQAAYAAAAEALHGEFARAT